MATFDILLHIFASCISTVLSLSHFLSAAHIQSQENHTVTTIGVLPTTSIRYLKKLLNGEKGGDPSLLKLTYVSISSSRCV